MSRNFQALIVCIMFGCAIGGCNSASKEQELQQQKLLMELAKANTESLDTIEKRQGELNKKEEEIKSRERSVQESLQSIKEREESLRKRDADATQRENAITTNEKSLAELNKKEEEIKSRERSVQESLQSIKEREESLGSESERLKRAWSEIQDARQAVARDERRIREFTQQREREQSAETLRVSRQNKEQAAAKAAEGSKALADGQYELAITYSNEALALDRGCAQAYCNRAAAELKKNKGAEAYGDFDVAISLDPKNATAYLGRGEANQYGPKDLGRALADFSEAIRLDPRSGKAYYLRGVAKGGWGPTERGGGSARYVKDLDAMQLGYRLGGDGRGREDMEKAMELRYKPDKEPDKE